MQKHAFKMVGAALMLMSSTALASTVLVTSRAALAGNDYVDWGTLGAVNTVVSNPFTINSNGGMTLTVSMPSGSFERRDQGNGWYGNFAPGDALLWNHGASEPVAVYNFATPVQGIGAQIQDDFLTGFTGQIDAYDSSNVLIGSFTEAGNSTSAGDNSAIFIGVLSSVANISKVAFSVVGQPDFALNRMDILTGSPVPLPAAVWSGGAALMGLIVVKRRRATA